MHSTVVGNPGREGLWGFGQILLRGVLEVVRNLGGHLFRVFLNIFMTIFF